MMSAKLKFCPIFAPKFSELTKKEKGLQERGAPTHQCLLQISQSSKICLPTLQQRANSM
ncbi:hypothetical protein ACJIZ3_014216 [Penstemon smallii]|uniref:Uncharacterized protein n=1 Tax=Penstemon smallii TaxID=265156 RepID=A0ABD3RJ85_9LAMI